MPDLARHSPGSRRSAPPGKVLVVRRPYKSVRPGDQPDRLPVRLAVGVIAGLGALGLIWLMGWIGFRLGFAPMVRVTDLTCDAADGLVTGVLMLTAAPGLIISAGMIQPLWLMIGFGLIAVPAAALSAARPATPGGPPPLQVNVILSRAAGIACGLNALLLIWWAASPVRLSMLGEMPVQGADFGPWLNGLHLVAGLDVLAFVAAGAWVVLSMRLMLPRWLRALCASAAIFALVVAAVAMSITGATATQVQSPRCLVRHDRPAADDASEPALLLGPTRHHLALMTVRDGQVNLELRNQSIELRVVGRQSLRELLERAAPAPTP